MKAIETVYNNYRFRSRLEARWAVFFDTLGVEYRYEHEGYDLDGICYLPDFWLPKLNCWIEIKPENPSEDEREKAKRLANATQKHVFILYGTLAPFSQHMEVVNNEPGELIKQGALGHAFFYREATRDVYFSDTFYMFGECSLCHNIVISFWGESSRCADLAGKRIEETNPYLLGSANECNCHNPTRDDFASPRLIAAYTAARQAQFEYGKRGR